MLTYVTAPVLLNKQNQCHKVDLKNGLNQKNIYEQYKEYAEIKSTIIINKTNQMKSHL